MLGRIGPKCGIQLSKHPFNDVSIYLWHKSECLCLLGSVAGRMVVCRGGLGGSIYNTASVDMVTQVILFNASTT